MFLITLYNELIINEICQINQLYSKGYVYLKGLKNRYGCKSYPALYLLSGLCDIRWFEVIGYKMHGITKMASG